MSAKEMHNVVEKYVKDGKVVVHEEYAIHGDKGTTIKFYHKENDKIMKFIVLKKADGYFMKSTIDGKTTEKEKLTKDEMLDELKKHKELKFAVDFVKSAKLSRAGSKKGSKKSSKRGSRRMSRKGSKRGSKKGSKKGSRRMSRKGSRKARKGSRK